MIWRLFGILGRLKIWVVLSCVVVLAARLMEAAIPILLGKQMDLVLAKTGLAPLIPGVITLAVLIVGMYLLRSINLLTMSVVGQVAIFRLRNRLYSHLTNLHIAFFDTSRTGQLISRTINDIDEINKGVSVGFVEALSSGLLLIAIVIGMFVTDARIGIIVCLSLPFVFGISLWFQNGQGKSFAWVRRALGHLNTHMHETIGGHSVIRLFGWQAREKQAFDVLNDDYRNANVRTIHYYGFFFASIDWIHNFMLTAVFVALVEFGLSGTEFRAGVFFTFSLYLQTFFWPIELLVESFNTLQDAAASAKRVFELLDTPQLVRSGDVIATHLESVEFRNVWFAYEEDNWILRDVSFTLGPQKVCALVGETGAGKSTIASLLLRFYDVNRGEILVNDRPIYTYTVESLRRLFALVLQDPVIFTGTVGDNVTLYADKREPDKLTAALQEVGGALPIEKECRTLSHGEKQLVSLARAGYQDRPALILDEATASVDRQSELKIQASLAHLFAKKMSLVIAHRLSTIESADEILHLSQGTIIERGTHHQLLQSKGPYERLYRAQYPT